MLSRNDLSVRFCYGLPLMREVCFGVQFGASQYLQGRLPKFLVFGFVPNCSNRCIISSFIACFSSVVSRDTKAFGIVFFSFLFGYVCLID